MDEMNKENELPDELPAFFGRTQITPPVHKDDSLLMDQFLSELQTERKNFEEMCRDGSPIAAMQSLDSSLQKDINDSDDISESAFLPAETNDWDEVDDDAFLPPVDDFLPPPAEAAFNITLATIDEPPAMEKQVSEQNALVEEHRKEMEALRLELEHAVANASAQAVAQSESVVRALEEKLERSTELLIEEKVELQRRVSELESALATQQLEAKETLERLHEESEKQKTAIAQEKDLMLRTAHDEYQHQLGELRQQMKQRELAFDEAEESSKTLNQQHQDEVDDLQKQLETVLAVGQTEKEQIEERLIEQHRREVGKLEQRLEELVANHQAGEGAMAHLREEQQQKLHEIEERNKKEVDGLQARIQELENQLVSAGEAHLIAMELLRQEAHETLVALEDSHRDQVCRIREQNEQQTSKELEEVKRSLALRSSLEIEQLRDEHSSAMEKLRAQNDRALLAAQSSVEKLHQQYFDEQEARLKSERDAAIAQLAVVENELVDTKAVVSDFQTDLHDRESTIAELETALLDEKELFEELDDAASSERQQLEVQHHREIEALQAHHAAQENNVLSVLLELDEVHKVSESIIAGLKTDNEQLCSRVWALQNAVDEAKSVRSDLEDQLQTLLIERQRTYNDLEEELFDVLEELDETEEKHKLASNDAASLHEKVQGLLSLEKEYMSHLHTLRETVQAKEAICEQQMGEIGNLKHAVEQAQLESETKLLQQVDVFRETKVFMEHQLEDLANALNMEHAIGEGLTVARLLEEVQGMQSRTRPQCEVSIQTSPMPQVGVAVQTEGMHVVKPIAMKTIDPVSARSSESSAASSTDIQRSPTSAFEASDVATRAEQVSNNTLVQEMVDAVDRAQEPVSTSTPKAIPIRKTPAREAIRKTKTPVSVELSKRRVPRSALKTPSSSRSVASKTTTRVSFTDQRRVNPILQRQAAADRKPGLKPPQAGGSSAIQSSTGFMAATKSSTSRVTGTGPSRSRKSGLKPPSGLKKPGTRSTGVPSRKSIRPPTSMVHESRSTSTTSKSSRIPSKVTVDDCYTGEARSDLSPKELVRGILGTFSPAPKKPQAEDESCETIDEAPHESSSPSVTSKFNNLFQSWSTAKKRAATASPCHEPVPYSLGASAKASRTKRTHMCDYQKEPKTPYQTPLRALSDDLHEQKKASLFSTPLLFSSMVESSSPEDLLLSPDPQPVNETGIETQTNAAVTLQSMVRRLLVRKSLGALKEEHEAFLVQVARRGEAATAIQAACRAFLVRLANRKTQEVNQSAVMIQRRIRGALARSLFACIRKEVAARMNRAACRLQAIVRGYIDRCRLERVKASIEAKQNRNATVLQACVRRSLARTRIRKVQSDREANKARSAIILQSWSRRLLALQQVAAFRHKVQREELGATVLQAWTRACMARRQLLKLRHESVLMMTRSATAIQAWTRACMARRQLLKLRHESALMMTRSAIAIQAWTRMLLAQKHVSSLRHELALMKTRSVISIQAWTRMLLAQKHVSSLRHELALMKTRSATAIQAWSRMLLAQKHVSSLYEKVMKKEISVVTIQALVRGFLARRSIATLRRSSLDKEMKVSILVQRTVRGWLSRRRASKLRSEKAGRNRLPDLEAKLSTRLNTPVTSTTDEVNYGMNVSEPRLMNYSTRSKKTDASMIFEDTDGDDILVGDHEDQSRPLRGLAMRRSQNSESTKPEQKARSTRQATTKAKQSSALMSLDAMLVAHLRDELVGYGFELKAIRRTLKAELKDMVSEERRARGLL